MCNKLQKKIFSVLALPFAFSIFMMSAGVTPLKAAEEADTASATPAVTVNHNGGSKTITHTPARTGGNKAAARTSGHSGANKSAVHASGRNGGSKATTHAARSGQAKPRAAGTHSGDKTHTQQKNTAPRKATHQ